MSLGGRKKNEIWKIVLGSPKKDLLRLHKILHSNRKTITLGGKNDGFLMEEARHGRGGALKGSLLTGGGGDRDRDRTLYDQYGCRSVRRGGEIRRGYLAVYVGEEMRRFVIPMSYLSFPEFMVLMDRVAEEFGFEQQGGLKIPCEQDDFEEVLLRCHEMHQKINKKNKKLTIRLT